MLSQELEETLRRSLSIAGERHHEFATLEHLLLAMIEDKDALAVMRGCNLDISRLKEFWKRFHLILTDEIESSINENIIVSVLPFVW